MCVSENGTCLCGVMLYWSGFNFCCHFSCNTVYIIPTYFFYKTRGTLFLLCSLVFSWNMTVLKRCWLLWMVLVLVVISGHGNRFIGRWWWRGRVTLWWHHPTLSDAAREHARQHQVLHLWWCQGKESPVPNREVRSSSLCHKQYPQLSLCFLTILVFHTHHGLAFWLS